MVSPLYAPPSKKDEESSSFNRSQFSSSFLPIFNKGSILPVKRCSKEREKTSLLRSSQSREYAHSYSLFSLSRTRLEKTSPFSVNKRSGIYRSYSFDSPTICSITLSSWEPKPRRSTMSDPYISLILSKGSTL